jgi:hypothetical protein
MSAPRDRVEKSFRGGSQSVALGVYRWEDRLRQATLQLGAELCQIVSVGQVKVHVIRSQIATNLPRGSLGVDKPDSRSLRSWTFVGGAGSSVRRGR